MKKIFSLLIVLSLVLSLCVCACADGAVTVSDLNGREIRLDAPAERIVALSPSDCEILFALGAGECIVGRCADADYPEQVRDIPALDSGANLNLEQLISLKPQLVFMSDAIQTDEQVAAIESFGIQVVFTDTHTNNASLDGVYKAVELIGSLVGRDAQAQELIASMKSSFDALAPSEETEEKPNVYFEVSPLEWGLWSAGKGTFFDEICTLIGAENIFGDLTGWVEVSEEQIISRDPDFIVTITMDYGGEGSAVAEILSRPGWENITAVKNGCVTDFQDNELTRPAPRLAQGAAMLHEFIFGE